MGGMIEFCGVWLGLRRFLHEPRWAISGLHGIGRGANKRPKLRMILAESCAGSGVQPSRLSGGRRKAGIVPILERRRDSLRIFQDAACGCCFRANMTVMRKVMSKLMRKIRR